MFNCSTRRPQQVNEHCVTLRGGQHFRCGSIRSPMTMSPAPHTGRGNQCTSHTQGCNVSIDSDVVWLMIDQHPTLAMLVDQPRNAHNHRLVQACRHSTLSEHNVTMAVKSGQCPDKTHKLPAVGNCTWSKQGIKVLNTGSQPWHTTLAHNPGSQPRGKMSCSSTLSLSTAAVLRHCQ